MIHLALGGQLQMDAQLSEQVRYMTLQLQYKCLVACVCNSVKFARFDKVQSQ